ncbi:MAG: hypothetical protein JWM63_4939 [Gammaproteobacteria bacterium]|nr:hypothetical protein [Gammaproteobacteria bacterium]
MVLEQLDRLDDTAGVAEYPTAGGPHRRSVLDESVRHVEHDKRDLRTSSTVNAQSAGN